MMCLRPTCYNSARAKDLSVDLAENQPMDKIRFPTNEDGTLKSDSDEKFQFLTRR